MNFTEEKLEQAVIDLFKAEGYRHLTGEQIHKELPEVLLRDDLKQYLKQCSRNLRRPPVKESSQTEQK